MTAPLNSDEISNLLVEKDKAIIQAQEILNTVQAEQYKKKKELVEVSESVRKAKFILSRMRTEKEILTRQYWAARG